MERSSVTGANKSVPSAAAKMSEWECGSRKTGSHGRMNTTAQVEFPFAGRRRVRAVFDGGAISSDGGALLLGQIESRIHLIESLAAVLPDHRDPRYVTHSVGDLVRQRVMGIALGYEDCNDAATLRRDPVLKTLCGREPFDDNDLGSQPTLSRLENSIGPKTCYRLAATLVDSYCTRHKKRPREVVIDMDLTDDPTHGQQELAFFRSHYDNYVYLPLLVFDQEGDLITAVLLPGNVQGPKHIAKIIRRIILRLRAKWAQVPVLVRGDSGMSGPEIYDLCDELDVDFVLGLAPNVRLKKMAAPLQEKARRRFLRTRKKARLFTSFRYRARRRWQRSYRVVAKAEHQEQGPNVRFVVTTLGGRAADIYDKRYVPRGESSENSIKDFKRALKGDRLSCSRFWANQFRLILHAAAYVIAYELRRAARGTELEDVQMDTLRMRLLKVGVRVESTARRIWFHLSSSFAWKGLWLRIARILSPEPAT